MQTINPRIDRNYLCVATYDVAYKISLKLRKKILTLNYRTFARVEWDS